MKNLLKWGLVSGVAMGFLVVLAHQFLSASTQRKRDASVAALQEKLDALSPAAKHTGPLPERPIAGRQLSKQDSSDNRADLYEYWRNLEVLMNSIREDCSSIEEAHDAAMVLVLREHPEPVTESERAALEGAIQCRRAFCEALGELRNYQLGLANLYEDENWPDDLDRIRSLYWGEHSLRCVAIYASVVDDHSVAIETLATIPYVSRLVWRQYTEWTMSSWHDWSVVQRALKSDAVPQETWDHLLEALARYRDDRVLVEDLVQYSKWETRYIGVYPHPTQTYTLADNPFRYAQNWAYVHVTTPLYNHDVDRFSRAIAHLIDLAGRPYGEAHADLLAFCEAFDIEPSVEDLKFMRQNSSWYYVLTVSRETLYQNAITQANIDVARYAILLERFRARHGMYPDRLEDMASLFQTTPPLNPFTGKPYLYRRTEADYHLGYRAWREVLKEDGTQKRRPFCVIWNDPDGELAKHYLEAYRERLRAQKEE
jgi:hypothetical protein